jgi:hypothetical protein
MFADARDEDIVVDASDVSLCPAPSIDASVPLQSRTNRRFGGSDWV